MSDILGSLSCVGVCCFNSDGNRQIPVAGAANHGLTATLNQFPGACCGSVQAVERNFTSSPWTSQGIFPLSRNQ